MQSAVNPMKYVGPRIGTRPYTPACSGRNRTTETMNRAEETTSSVALVRSRPRTEARMVEVT